MLNVIMLLQSEHRNLAKLLDVIEQQAVNVRQNGDVNYGLLESAFEYLSGYPESCHHPKEDLVYRKLLKRAPELAGSLENLYEEHERITQATADMAQVLEMARQAPAPSDERLAARLSKYVERYQDHILLEDRSIFPAALARLSQEDFFEIDFSLFDRPDPLLDGDAEARFATLHNEIMRVGAAETSKSDARKEAILLATMQHIGAFNEVMRDFGERISLIGSPKEGYELRNEDSVMGHIPECSESTAAWCAYFFWKAWTRKREVCLAT